jgi:hypothetical protein
MPADRLVLDANGVTLSRLSNQVKKLAGVVRRGVFENDLREGLAGAEKRPVGTVRISRRPSVGEGLTFTGKTLGLASLAQVTNLLLAGS